MKSAIDSILQAISEYEIGLYELFAIVNQPMNMIEDIAEAAIDFQRILKTLPALTLERLRNLKSLISIAASPKTSREILETAAMETAINFFICSAIAADIIRISEMNFDGKTEGEPSNYTDAMALQSSIIESISTASDDIFQSMRTLKAAFLADMRERAILLPKLISIPVKSPKPLIVIAYDHFGDAEKDAKILKRNNIAHPNFVPVGHLEALET